MGLTRMHQQPFLRVQFCFAARMRAAIPVYRWASITPPRHFPVCQPPTRLPPARPSSVCWQVVNGLAGW